METPTPPAERSKRAEREDSRRSAPPARSAQPGAERTRGQATKRKPGRPTEHEDSVVVSVRLPAEIVEKIEGVVAKSGHFYRDRSEYIRQTVVAAVAALETAGIEVVDINALMAENRRLLARRMFEEDSTPPPRRRRR